jgi:hypothetical protein
MKYYFSGGMSCAGEERAKIYGEKIVGHKTLARNPVRNNNLENLS